MKRAAPLDVISNRKKDCSVSGLSGIYCKGCRNSTCACGKLGKVIAYQRIHAECAQVNTPDLCVGEDRCKRFLCVERLAEFYIGNIGGRFCKHRVRAWGERVAVVVNTHQVAQPSGKYRRDQL